MEVLILRLEAPLMSFGDVAVDEIRPTARLPARSLLTGLLGNALGLEHTDVEQLDRLQDRLRFAARLDREGSLLRDFQTAELCQNDRAWTTRGRAAKRDGGDKTYEGPALRDRRYRADAVVTVALALDPPDEPPSLATIAAALRRPERPLFIGRKGCPPSRQLLEDSLQAESLVTALDKAALLRPDTNRRHEIETEDTSQEPASDHLKTMADRRDWQLGLHMGESRRRVLWQAVAESA